MKDQELEEILTEANCVYRDGYDFKKKEWKPGITRKLLAWRDKAVREALLDFASRVGETSYEVDEYLKEQYQQELQDGK